MKEIWEENTKTQARNLKVRKELATFLCSSDVKKAATSD